MNLAGRPGLARLVVETASQPGAVFEDDVDLGEAVRVMEGGFRANDLAVARRRGEVACTVVDPTHEDSAAAGRPCPLCRAVV